MGLDGSKILRLEQSEADIFIPHKKYRPFPIELRDQPRTICIKFRPTPPSKEYDELRDISWIVDCQFIPCSDDELITSCGAVDIWSRRTNMFPQGLICKWRLGMTTACRIYPGTSTCSQPRIHPHPNGEYVCYVGRQKICVQDLETGAVVDRERNLSYESLRSCDVSPNGAYLAFISRAGVQFELVVVEKRSVAFRVVSRVRCREINRAFEGTRSYTELVECKWSPDSQFIAIAISTGYLSVVDCRNEERLESYLNVVDEFKNVDRLANTLTFDFDPKSAHSILAFATRGVANELHICNSDKKAVVRSTSLSTDGEGSDGDRADGDGEIGCLRYSRRGDVIAAANGVRIRILNSENLRVIYILDGAAQDYGGYARRLPSWKYPSILQLSFSRFDEYLAVSSMDGFIRVWQLDADLNLQNLCRKVILASTCCDRVKFLPIPDRLKLYLLQIPDWAAARGAEAYL
ncbi:uncharacterized protein LOC141902643 [Tubulanus polymorphus]|uniref:uncharacterized protein LOC141902643 n=1 Tax=Tubulanus polymorphus TaxID=672921 RepID=UPI003DA1DD07